MSSERILSPTSQSNPLPPRGFDRSMTKAGEEAALEELRAIRALAERIVDRIFPGTRAIEGGQDAAMRALVELKQKPDMGGQGGGTNTPEGAGPGARVQSAAPANPVPAMNPMPWARDVIGRPVQAQPSSLAVSSSPPAPGQPFYEPTRFIGGRPYMFAGMCANNDGNPVYVNFQPRSGTPLVCMDCFRRSRGTR